MQVVLRALKKSVEHSAFHGWNYHRVRTINERNIYHPGHVPFSSFEAVERERKEILPPPYEHGQPYATQDFVDEEDSQQVVQQDEVNLEIGAEDIKCEQVHATRDRAYLIGLKVICHDVQDIDTQEVDLTVKVRLWLALSYECAYAEESNIPLRHYVQHMSIAEHPQLPHVKRFLEAALNI